MIIKSLMGMSNPMVSYDPNGGTGSIAPSVILRRDSTQLSDGTGFSRVGATLAGWITNVGHETNDYELGGLLGYGTTEGPVTLYARWTTAVSFDGNGADGGGPMDAEVYTAVSTGKTLTANTFTRTSHRFIGWNTDSMGGGSPYADEEVLTWWFAEDTILYAQWELLATVTYDGNGADGGGPMDPTAYPAGDLEFHSLRVNTFTRTGYTFGIDHTTVIQCWAEDPDGTIGSFDDGQAIQPWFNSDITLYAQWTPILTTITFDGNGALYGGTSPQTEQSVTEHFLAANGFDKGDEYYFTGWNTDINGNGTAYFDMEYIMWPLENITLYAMWAPKIRIDYDGNGGSGVTNPTFFIPNTGTINLQYNWFTPPIQGYYFAGWSTSPTGAVEYLGGANIEPFSVNTTLYAIWADGA